MSATVKQPSDTVQISPIWTNTKWFASGAFSGMMNTLAGHPLDTLKIRLQTEGVHGRFNGLYDCLKKTVIEEGFFRGLYKGLTPPFFGMGIINMMMFGIFGNVRKIVGNNLNNGNMNLTISQTAISGAITGPLVSCVVVPVEQVKARLQVQYALPKGVKPEYTGPIDCIKKLIKNNGFSGLYKGLPSTLMTRVHCWAYFSGQEACRLYFVKKSGKENYTLTVSEQFLTGGAAGTCYWIFAFPFDVVKNRMMSQPDTKIRKYPTVLSCWKHIWQVDGLKGFTRGFVPCALRTLPANGATWVAIKLARDFLEKFDIYFVS